MPPPLATSDFKETLRQQADIVRIVGEYVKLKKAGASAYFEKSLLDLDKDGHGLVKAVQRVLAELPCAKENFVKPAIAGVL